MKRKIWKRAGSILLAMTLTLGCLAGCGKGSGDGNRGGNGGGGGGSAANASLAKEHVYRYQELELPEFGGDDIGVQALVKTDDKLRLLVTVYNWNQNSQTDFRLVSMNFDGSDMETVQLDVPDTKPEGVPEMTGTGLPAPGAGARTETAENEGDGEDEEAGEDTSEDAGPEPDMTVESTAYEYTGCGNFVLGSNSIYALCNYNYEDYSDETNPVSVSANYLCCWNYDGSLRWETDLGELSTEDEYIYIQTMAETADGGVNILMNGNDSYLQKAEADGTLGERKMLAKEVYNALQSGTMISKADGKFLAVYYSEDYVKQYIAEFDMEAGTLGEPVELPAAIAYGGFGAMNSGASSDLIYVTSNGVFGYNLGDDQGVEKMNFINSDVALTSMQSVLELDKDTIVGVFYDNATNTTKAGLFTYVPPEEIPDKKVLVLAASYVGYDIRNRAVEFNRSSQEYRIIVKDYSAYNTNEDYSAGMNQLDSDILTGNMPDIIELNDSRMDVNKYISKGLLADIGKLIEEDEELSQVEFVQNVFDAYSVDGKLYQIIPSFGIRTMVAKKSLVGDKTTWTMQEMLDILDTLPEGAVAIDSMTRAWFMALMMNFCGSDFVDVDTGKCNFNTENFIAMMEFAKSLPEEINYDDDYWINYDGMALLRENKVLMSQSSIYRLRDENQFINGTYGGDMAFIGFPTDSGKGSVVEAYDTYVISAKSENVDGAWEFLRYYLTKDYQETQDYNLPVRKDVFEEKAQEATQKPYYLDENGNKVEYDETYWVNDEEIPLPPMTKEQVDWIVDFVYSVDKPVYYNEDVMNIINEEMDAYFKDQKTAQDVAGIIQNRVQLFVDENGV